LLGWVAAPDRRRCIAARYKCDEIERAQALPGDWSDRRCEAGWELLILVCGRKWPANGYVTGEVSEFRVRITTAETRTIANFKDTVQSGRTNEKPASRTITRNWVENERREHRPVTDCPSGREIRVRARRRICARSA
jgi:hypothetical protein